jgi:cytochrome P450
MAYLVQNPDLCTTIRDEVAPIVSTGRTPNEISDCLDRCPRLLAVYQETLRIVTSSVSVRNVVKPLVLGGKLLRPGSRVLIPYRQILMDEAVFGPDAANFNPVRFLNDKTLSKSPSFRPFGSGTTHCPGRFLAQKEILTFIGVALSRFDVYKAAETSRGATFPRLELKKPCLGIVAPVKGDDIIVTVRPLSF